MVRSLSLSGCWMFTQARRLLVGSKYRPVNSEPTRAVRCPTRRFLRRRRQIAVPVQVLGEPDVVVDTAVAVLDDVDVAVVVDGQVVGARQRTADRRAGGQVDGAPVGEDRDRVGSSGRAGRPRCVVVVVTYRYSAPCTVWICMSSGRW